MISGRTDPPLSPAGAGVLFRALSELLTAGASLDRALTAASDLVPESARTAVLSLQMRIRLGESLSAALVATGARVPGAAIGLLRAGERGRGLEEALLRAAEHMEQQAELAATVRQALAYPAVLCVAAIGALGVLVGVVVPRLSGILSDLGQPLPAALATIELVRRFLAEHALLVGTTGMTFGAVVIWASRTPLGRTALDRAASRAPAVGPALRNLAAGRFALTLSQLLQAGLRLPEALTFAGQASGSSQMERAAAEARSRLLLGEPLSAALAATGALPVSVLAFVRIGEAGEGLTGALRQAGHICQASGTRRLRTAMSLLEPALILSVALAVGMVASSLLRAVYAIRVPGP